MGNGDEVRGLPDDDRARLDPHGAACRPTSVREQALDRSKNFGADPIPRDAHAGQGRVSEAAGELIIVGADHGEMLGHRKLCVAADLEHLPGNVVVDGEQAGGPGQGGEPACQGGVGMRPVFEVVLPRRFHDERGAGEAPARESPAKAFLTELGIRVRFADKRERVKIPREQMLGGDDADTARKCANMPRARRWAVMASRTRAIVAERVTGVEPDGRSTRKPRLRDKKGANRKGSRLKG